MSDMSLEYIRDYYKVPARKGQRVVAYGKPGVITGARNQYVKIKLDGEDHSDSYHPKDGIEYLDTPTAFHVDINVRWASLTYQASCPGQKLRATSVIHQKSAARALVMKLHPAARVDQVECIKAATQGQTEVWRCHLSFEE